MLPEHNLVVLELDHRPGKWLELAEQPVSLDAEVTFLVPRRFPPIHTGAVVAQRLSYLTNLPKMSFVPVLSIGTQAPSKTRPDGGNLCDGCPLVDATGQVVGVMGSLMPQASHLPEEYVRPPPQARIGKHHTAPGRLAGLRPRPDGPRGGSGTRPLHAPAPARYRRIRTGDYDAGIAVLEKMAELSSQGFFQPAAMLASGYRNRAMQSGQRSDWLSAAKWYEKAVTASPDRLDQLMDYQAVLNQLGCWDEVSRINEQAWRLEECYRSR